VWLDGVHISPYRFAVGVGAHDPDRARKLLLNRQEIDRLHDRVARERLSLVPLALKLVDGRVKVELALARGRRKGDKRQVIAERDVQREMQRAIGRQRKGME
jgi:SsrA-binding protein